MAQPPDDRPPAPWEPLRPDDAPTAPIPTPAPAPIEPASPTESPTPPAEPIGPTAVPGEPSVPAAAGPIISWEPSRSTASTTPAAPAAPAGQGGSGWVVPDGATPGPPGTPLAESPAAPVIADPSAVVGWEVPGTAAPIAGPVVAGYEVAGIGARLVAWLFDTALVVIVVILALGGVITVYPDITRDTTAGNLLLSVLWAGLSFLYFVGLWTSGGGATLGMRLLSMRIVRSLDGGVFGIGSAVIRWAAFGYPLYLFATMPELAGVASVVSTILPLVLLITTIASDRRQGLHDRWANSSILRRAGSSDTPAMIGCILVIAVLLGLFVVAPLWIFSQLDPDLIEEILSEIGQSI